MIYSLPKQNKNYIIIIGTYYDVLHRCECVTRAALLLYCVRDGTRMLPAQNASPPLRPARAERRRRRGGASRRTQLLQPEPSARD